MDVWECKGQWKGKKRKGNEVDGEGVISVRERTRVG